MVAHVHGRGGGEVRLGCLTVLEVNETACTYDGTQWGDAGNAQWAHTHTHTLTHTHTYLYTYTHPYMLENTE